ncbi:uncharacterized protein LOC129584757 [Paramacrobiotus metropolitanus]|uniref:uncharacterized protein LOC129584757 n=1 Tax=Paramacrobiotus metropolitanus TaxID=2943436 RepID=UPI002446018C|nr:uncharacterized protein LOC129584757 [Paramacrobiotus metropolitanus]
MDLGIIHRENFGSSCAYDYKSNVDFIARGAFGVIYRATITDRGNFKGEQIVAVKTVHLDKDAEIWTCSTKWEKCLTRLKMLLAIGHENLVAYHKITITKNLGRSSVELMMDYYPDGDLADHLKKYYDNKELSKWSVAVSFATDIAHGLHFLHSHNVIHGDLKPANVLVKAGSAFGISYSQHRLLIGDLDDLVQMKRSVTCTDDITHLRGTIRFMSPEMLRKFSQTSLPAENPGRKTDMWSLGCIMLELAGCIIGTERKWLRKNKFQKLEAGDKLTDPAFAKLIIDGYVPFVPNCEEISGPFATCIERCLCISSEKRIPADELLQKLLEESPSYVGPTETVFKKQMRENLKIPVKGGQKTRDYRHPISSVVPQQILASYELPHSSVSVTKTDECGSSYDARICCGTTLEMG